MFNLTHCIMCTTHDRLTAFWAKPWMTSLTQLLCIKSGIFSNIDIEKSLNSVRFSHNSDRYTNDDAGIRSDRLQAKVLHSSAWDGRCSKEGVLRECPGDVCPDGGAFVDTTVIDRCRSVSTCGTDGKCCYRGTFQDLMQVACTLLQTDHIFVNDSNKCC